jgi:flagellar hook-associated protein 2
MVSQISLGTFFNENGRNIVTGGNSGFDVKTIIDTLSQAKGFQATYNKQKIAKDSAVASKLNEFKNLVSNFQSIANNLRNPPGIDSSSNAFLYNSINVTSNTTVSGSTYVTASAQPGVTPQNFKISNITSIAAIAKQTTDPLVPFVIGDTQTAGLVVASGAGAGQFNAGTFTFHGADITLETDDSLEDIKQKFNNVSLQTNVVASIITQSDGNYVLSFTATHSGAAYSFDLDSPLTVTADPDGVLSALNFDDTQTAADAQFDLDGVTITRPSNSVSDAVHGVTFNILQTTPALTEVTVAVTSDTSTARTSIVNLADSYNALKQFEAGQLKTNDDGTYAGTSILATNQLFRGIMNTITSQMLSVVNGLTDGDPDNLTDLGITFTKVAASGDTPEISNALTIDQTTLDSFLASNFDAVRRVFEFSFSSDNTNLQVFKRTNALSINDFTLDVNPFATQVIDSINVADADTQIVFAAATDGQFKPGVITINGQTITLVDGDTLNTIATKFNATTLNSGVTATVSGSAGDFTLTFDSVRQNNKANLFDLSSTTQNPSSVFNDLDITATGSYKATYDPGTGSTTVDLTGEAIAGGGGYILTGPNGSAIEGLELIYANQAASTSSVEVTQGVADKLYNISDGFLAPDTGSLAAELDSIKEADTRLTDQNTRIDAQVAIYREFLIAQFTALEQALAQSNTLLQSLDADAKARQLASG